LRHVLIGSLNSSLFTLVAIVRLDFLARCKHLLQSTSKDCEVGPLATGEWAMDPDNITSLNTDSDLIVQTAAWNLWENHFLLNGFGSKIRKSVPSTVTLHILP
jgi:hypothetical protein